MCVFSLWKWLISVFRIRICPKAIKREKNVFLKNHYSSTVYILYSWFRRSAITFCLSFFHHFSFYWFMRFHFSSSPIIVKQNELKIVFKYLFFGLIVALLRLSASEVKRTGHYNYSVALFIIYNWKKRRSDNFE